MHRPVYSRYAGACSTGRVTLTTFVLPCREAVHEAWRARFAEPRSPLAC
jgi:hypothetical protein